MTKFFGPRSKDAAHSLAEAAQDGQDDGRGGHPKPSPSGELPLDYYGLGAEAEADTAGRLHFAGHVGEDRPRLDRAIAELVGRVVWLTSVVSDALFKVAAADHTRQTYRSLSPADRRQPWPAGLRLLLLGVMAAGTGAALAGALLELTSDEPYYVWGFCLAVTLAVVGLGAFVAHLARDFEYGFTKGRLPKTILGVSGSFVVAFMVALAVIRGTAADADAERQSRSSDSGLMLPDQPGSTDTQGSTDDVEKESLPSVPAYVYGCLEGLLFAGAFGVEYLNYLPWAKDEKRAVKALRAAEREVHDGKAQLGPACGQLMATLDERADQDASVLITAEATMIHAVAEMAEYRRALASSRPSSQGGDPFQGVDLPPLSAVLGTSSISDNGKTTGSVTRQVAERWGRDLQPSGLISDQPYDRMDIDQLAATALARGLAVLAKVPERATFTPITWDPASLVNDTNSAPIGVKRANRSTNRKPARRATKRGSSDGARQ